MREAMQRLAAAKWKGLFAALFFGGMAAVGHEPFGLYTVSIVAFAMGLGLVLDAPSWKRAGVLGWMVGTGVKRALRLSCASAAKIEGTRACSSALVSASPVAMPPFDIPRMYRLNIMIVSLVAMAAGSGAPFRRWAAPPPV